MRRFSISAHHCAEIKKGQYHLGKTNTKGTYENNLSESIIDIITKFNLEKKNVGFTCYGGANMKKCSYIICSELDHTAVFSPKKPLFAMGFLVHVISG